MDIFKTMEILASGLGAERVRMNVSASNLANVNTTRTAEGGPYKRRDAVFASTPLQDGPVFSDTLNDALNLVEVSDIVQDDMPPRLEYDPGHPDADERGYVAKPNVNLAEEMVNMVTASRAYEAGVSAMQSVTEMARRALSIGK